MRIDVQIPAPLRQQVAADFLLPILEGGEIVAEVQASMTAFTLIFHKQTGDLLAPCQPLYSTLEFPTLHTSSLGQFCPIVKRRGQGGCPAVFDCVLCSSGVPTSLRVADSDLCHSGSRKWHSREPNAGFTPIKRSSPSLGLSQPP